MHCQRFIVHGFNGALTPLPPCVATTSPLTRANTQASIIPASSTSCFPLSSLSSLYQLSISRLPLLFISRLPFTFVFFFFSLLLPTSYQTASSASPVAHLIESAVKIQMSKSGSFQWRENKSSALFRGKMPTGGDDTVILLCFHKLLSAPHKHHVAVYETLTINPRDLWNNACCHPASLISCLSPVEMLPSCVGLIACKTLMYSLGRAGAPWILSSVCQD